MSYASPAAQYQETAVFSASPAQLVVMIYDHLLLSLRRARLGVEKQNPELRGASFDRSRAAVSELLVTLDHERGGEVAKQLSGVYSFILSELVALGLRPDLARLDRVIGMVADLREAFDTIARQPAAREVA